MTSWPDRLRHALQAHALITAGDHARGITTTPAAIAAVRDVQAAITHAERHGATEADLDAVITDATSLR